MAARVSNSQTASFTLYRVHSAGTRTHGCPQYTSGSVPQPSSWVALVRRRFFNYANYLPRTALRSDTQCKEAARRGGRGTDRPDQWRSLTSLPYLCYVVL